MYGRHRQFQEKDLFAAGDFSSWCQAATESVSLDEARTVPHFGVAWDCYRGWRELRNGEVPDRQDLDPLRFGPALLPYMSLIEAIDDADDYRWRLCGECAAYVMGMSMTRKCLSEIEKDEGERVLFRDALDRVMHQRQPLFYVLRHRSVDGGRKRSYGVLLPLRERGELNPTGRPQHVLGACDWTIGA